MEAQANVISQTHRTPPHPPHPTSTKLHGSLWNGRQLPMCKSLHRQYDVYAQRVCTINLDKQQEFARSNRKTTRLHGRSRLLMKCPLTQMASKAVRFTPVLLYEGWRQKLVFQGDLHSCDHHCLQNFLGLHVSPSSLLLLFFKATAKLLSKLCLSLLLLQSNGRFYRVFCAVSNRSTST